MKVMLASASPRRLMLLQAAGIGVLVQPQHVDESPLPNEKIEHMVTRLARLKLQSCTEKALPIIAADTLVALDGIAFGQPASADKARKMLQNLSGREHMVHSAVAVGYRMSTATALVSTHVRFRSLSDQEITNYLHHNDVLDKAGGYAIQGGAASFITAIDGPLDNVIGLPIQQTIQLLAELSAPNG